jgi:hypothetical protein
MNFTPLSLYGERVFYYYWVLFRDPLGKTVQMGQKYTVSHDASPDVLMAAADEIDRLQAEIRCMHKLNQTWEEAA